MAEELERLDIQGIVLSAYAHLECAAYQMLRVTDAKAARAWLGLLAGKITDARGKKDNCSRNIAFTASGLKNLGLDDETIASFAWPFRDGMISDHRQRILGDTDVNEPKNWRWGNGDKPIDIVLMLYAENDTIIAGELAFATAAGTGVEEVVALVGGRQQGTKEHFGFNDGIAQPAIEGTKHKKREEDRAGAADEIKQGEVLLGHEDDYGGPSPSPMVAAARDPKNLLRAADDKRHDLGYNGTYLVFRQMEQDVTAFWNFVAQSGDPDKLAAKLVGRWTSGAPLVKYPDADPHPDELTRDDDFDYQSDPLGVKCPIGSHIRRTNPRDTLGPDPATAKKSANRHRLLRRGRSYGSRIADPHKPDGKERGLHFICIGSDIARQFEFVQQQWVNNTVFGGLYSEVDPLIGDQTRCSGIFTVPGDPLRTRVPNLCRFTTIRGGAYFFVPSIRALRYLSAL